MAKEKISYNFDDFERDIFQSKQRIELENCFLIKMLDYSNQIL